MYRFLAAVALCAAILAGASPAFCAELYEDSKTGQIFSKPGDGRVAVQLPAERVSGLYTDANGNVYAKPGDGRTALAVSEAAPVAAVPAPKSMTKEEVLALLPEWQQRLKMSGDLRLRYQWEKKEFAGNPTVPPTTTNAALAERQRAKLRARIEVAADVVKSVKAYVGLASTMNDTTGGLDGRSTNYTFGAFNEHPIIALDYAYADYNAFNGVNILGGVMKNPFYTVSQLTWDVDTRPQGGAVKINEPVNSRMNLLMNGGVFVLNELNGPQIDVKHAVAGGGYNSGHVSPWMYELQAGLDTKPCKNVSFKAMLNYYGYQNLKGLVKTTVSSSGATSSNTAIVVGGANYYKYAYNAVGTAGELGYDNLISGKVNYAGVFGEYIHNPGAPQDNNGTILGLVIGDRKVKNRGDWQYLVDWRRLEKDCEPDFMSESDFLNGATNVQGTHMTATYGLYKNFALSLNWYHAAQISDRVITYSVTGVPTSARVARPNFNLLEADVLFTF